MIFKSIFLTFLKVFVSSGGKGAHFPVPFFPICASWLTRAARDLKFRAGLIVNIRRAAILCRCSLALSRSRVYNGYNILQFGCKISPVCVCRAEQTAAASPGRHSQCFEWSASVFRLRVCVCVCSSHFHNSTVCIRVCVLHWRREREKERVLPRMRLPLASSHCGRDSSDKSAPLYYPRTLRWLRPNPLHAVFSASYTRLKADIVTKLSQ